jgi:ATP-dependent Zn protease
MPNSTQRSGGSAVTRTIIFWVMMIALAVFLWSMASRQGPQQPQASPMSYSDFMGQVDKNNVASVKLLEGRTTTKVQGTLREPATTFGATIPNEVIPDLTERLRKQGAAIEVHEATGADPASVVSLAENLAPILFIAVIAIFIFRARKRSAQLSQRQGTPSNRPLG